MGAGFATWVLQRDGLRVRPFDVHPPGEGLLGSFGLDEASWRGWMGAIVHNEDRLAEAISAYDVRRIAPDERFKVNELEERRNPVASWVGDPAMRRALEGLWRTYQPIGEAWAGTMTSTERHSRISAGQERRLWPCEKQRGFT